MTIYAGSCHCGAVAFEVEADPVELTVCDCSLCRRRSATMMQVPVSALTILRGEDHLTLYQWNTGVARHYFCDVCGIYPFHRKRSDPNSYGVNVGCLEGFDPTRIPLRRADGVSMTVEGEHPREEWRGPRT